MAEAAEKAAAATEAEATALAAPFPIPRLLPPLLALKDRRKQRRLDVALVIGSPADASSGGRSTSGSSTSSSSTSGSSTSSSSSCDRFFLLSPSSSLLLSDALPGPSQQRPAPGRRRRVRRGARCLGQGQQAPLRGRPRPEEDARGLHQHYAAADAQHAGQRERRGAAGGLLFGRSAERHEHERLREQLTAVSKSKNLFFVIGEKKDRERKRV